MNTLEQTTRETEKDRESRDQTRAAMDELAYELSKTVFEVLIEQEHDVRYRVLQSVAALYGMRSPCGDER